jgi:hypothetical protein
MVMYTRDPPSVERNKAGVWKRARGICRWLVHKRTIKAAIRVIALVTRIARLFDQLIR